MCRADMQGYFTYSIDLAIGMVFSPVLMVQEKNEEGAKDFLKFEL